ncbi:hypothetical protein FACS1894109_20990 [Spirochaetia bacterium]|nr:hypothetical protein FACS1894109_20990 [Spirochaetia bacterium]
MPYDISEEKEELTNKLSQQYSRNVIDIEEYERIVEYINKVETSKEMSIIKKVIQEHDLKNNDALIFPQNTETHLALFSWRSSNVVSLNGNGGSYLSLFGTNKIIIDNLPKGRTIIQVDSIFGLTEIVVSRNIKIVNKTIPVFSGIFAPDEINKENEDLPELYITGMAVFGNITIKRV